MIHDLPPHIARPTNSLVGPLVRFRGQSVAITSSPPSNTLDPRYLSCTNHHLACDCREAEKNEQIAEYRGQYWHMRELFDALTDGHPTRVYVSGERRSDLECQCPLCAFGRQAGLDRAIHARRIDGWVR
ncbi:hypothetical protein A5733_04295 [Mycobacterium sp. NS-7484]|uniref:hypothetical protein n=1 Tax=Mycobacterium sp. NS-7484 TaxID=1834161 RepID=UPI00096FACA8|nr:hypothetical protein [Mycobacterium sp. NS-7484]OMC00337.1 hypothetical protein A5733_04295 [Mycobacterium sp. NS-7484]